MEIRRFPQHFHTFDLTWTIGILLDLLWVDFLCNPNVYRIPLFYLLQDNIRAQHNTWSTHVFGRSRQVILLSTGSRKQGAAFAEYRDTLKLLDAPKLRNVLEDWHTKDGFKPPERPIKTASSAHIDRKSFHCSNCYSFKGHQACSLAAALPFAVL